MLAARDLDPGQTSEGKQRLWRLGSSEGEQYHF